MPAALRGVAEVEALVAALVLRGHRAVGVISFAARDAPAVLRRFAFAAETHDHVRIVAVEDDVADLEVPVIVQATYPKAEVVAPFPGTSDRLAIAVTPLSAIPLHARLSVRTPDAAARQNLLDVLEIDGLWQVSGETGFQSFPAIRFARVAAESDDRDFRASG
jgi:hypothetical protein